MAHVNKTVLKWRDARIARAHGNILNVSHAYVYCAYEFKLRVRLLRLRILVAWTFYWPNFETVFEQLWCLLESFLPFNV